MVPHSTPIRMLALLPLVVVAALLGGCNEELIDATKTEQLLEHEMPSLLQSTQGEEVTKALDISSDDPASVSCPTDQEIEVGATFLCEASFGGGKRASVKLEIRDDEANLSTVSIVALGSNK